MELSFFFCHTFGEFIPPLYYPKEKSETRWNRSLCLPNKDNKELYYNWSNWLIYENYIYDVIYVLKQWVPIMILFVSPCMALLVSNSLYNQSMSNECNNISHTSHFIIQRSFLVVFAAPFNDPSLSFLIWRTVQGQCN
jgi:hypothetical protein